MKFAKQILIATLVAVMPVTALAQGIVLQTDAFQDVVVKDKAGKVEKKRQKVSTAVPGGEIVYVITYRNSGDKPATGVVVNNAVPANLAYVAGSAEGAGARAEVSVDGGKAFGTLEKLTVRNADGSTRPARGEDVTHLRWRVNGAVGVGRQGTVTYRAIVR